MNLMEGLEELGSKLLGYNYTNSPHEASTLSCKLMLAGLERFKFLVNLS